MPLRPRAAEHADHRRLAGHRVLAGLICRPGPDRLRRSRRSSAIWNAWPTAGRSARARRAAASVAEPRMPPAWQAKRNKRAGLHRLQACGPPSSPSRCGPPPSKRPSAARSSICPPTMPPRPAARASARRDSMRTAGSGWVSRARQDVEGEGQQAIAGEDGGRFVEFLVRRRLPAPQVVIVHRRQVVVHQRVAMHAFERRAGHQRLLARDLEQRRAFHHQEGPEPLAAAEAGIAHGLDQARRRG